MNTHREAGTVDEVRNPPFALLGDGTDSIADACAKACAIAARSGDLFLESLFHALQQIWQNCEKNSSELTRHRESYVEARDRERRLRRDVNALLDVIGERLAPPAQPSRTSPMAGIDDRIAAAEPARVQLQACTEVIRRLTDPPVDVEGATATDAVDEGGQMPARPEPGQAAPLPPTSAYSIFVGPQATASPSLVVCMLGPFQVLLDDEPVQGWPNGRGKAIFKYLVIQRKRPVPKEVLMDLFWPDADAAAARNNLNVAVYGLRKALGSINPEFSYVVYESGLYTLNPSLSIWVDAEDFEAHVTKARRRDEQGDEEGAMAEFRAAEALYQCELLPEDRYEEWFSDLRKHYQELYVGTLDWLGDYFERNGRLSDCIAVSRKLLALDRCNEAPVRRMMRSYAAMGQRHLALRQYRILVESLDQELQLAPSQETARLFDQMRRGIGA
ncbi:MAG TPA: BTAD domain-containing putative transcriptional regulator [Burkholderiaceae bacterium]|nr:BTAD domain-containing putative transcriptional regulator [Burkholderiaceae bacterium]